MDSQTSYAILESIKLINKALEKITSRIEVLENDYKERFIKRKLVHWFFTGYPLVIVAVFACVLQNDHASMKQIFTDTSKIIREYNQIYV